jgi:AcrR family transcriptional regulator
LRIKMSVDTRDRIVEATIEAIKRHGSAGASARTIAEIAGCNQALLYYHFGSLKALLVVALEATSQKRLALYKGETQTVSSLEELVAAAKRLYAEDVANGYVTVLSELVSACLTHPDLRPEVLARLEPWVDLAEGLINRIAGTTPFAAFLPGRDLAQALVAFYMGMEMFHNLDGDSSRADRLFDAFSTLAAVASPLLSAVTQS